MSDRGFAYDAARILSTLRYKDGVDANVLGYAARLINRAASTTAQVKVNIPSDYNRGIPSMLHPPFRIINDSSRFPKPFPAGLALPPIVGNGNDHGFLQDAANVCVRAAPTQAIDVVHPYRSEDSLDTLLVSLRSQNHAGSVRLHVFRGNAMRKLSSDLIEVVQHPAVFPSSEANERLLRIASGTDILLFVSGLVVLEPSLLQRIARIAAVSDRVVHPLVPAAFGEGVTAFSTKLTKTYFRRAHPFRDLLGLNFAAPASLFRESGGFDPRFTKPFNAARELCYRLWNRGCYLCPAATNEVRKFKDSDAADDALFRELCPNHLDRADGVFEVPKVSIYIPAYNASRYIIRAVESALDQDVHDLEVCIADDGSRDNTLQVLEQRFSDNPKVRWSTNPNGGIGFASNRAITMARGLYIGQLDSDDCLKPGAVRKLATYLDEHPDVVCCYSSCERVDASGNYTKDEYSWPVFSREKMMVTSITHHFRMFRKRAWELTEKFREDIINAVDYDMFLKLSEVGHFHHIEERLYQRRWHGANTSNINEAHQTANTHRVQREALQRQGLFNFWDIHIEKPDQPRRVSYRRRPGRKLVMFWPYYRANPYQRLLYAPHAHEMEFCAGTIDAALREIRNSENPNDHVFHLHWLNFLFKHELTSADAQDAADLLISKIEEFKGLGGTVAWTIHNTTSHDAKHADIEIALSARLSQAVDILHLHFARSIPEVSRIFPLPEEKVRIARHGHYIGAYPDIVSREVARCCLKLSPDDDVILFNGQVRAYKGIDSLIAAFRNILAGRPNAVLLIAGAATEDPIAGLEEPLTPFEQSRLKFMNRYIDDAELQVFLRAADFAVYPYRSILTSGSLMLALSFGLPVIMPDVGMAREVVEGSSSAILYDGSAAKLEGAMLRMLAMKDSGELAEARENARQLAESHSWQRLF